jgi:hypothetical protein
MAVAQPGDVVTRQLDLADFNSVEARSAFDVQITQSDRFSVTISADENIVDQVQVKKTGSTLRLYLDAGSASLNPFGRATPQVMITMPRLEEIQLSGASHAEIKGFKSQQDVAVKLSGASWLKGTIEPRSIRFDVSGASNVNDLEGSAETMTIASSGASHLDLQDFRVQTATVRLSGASSARLNAWDRLDYELSGAARLDYLGTPRIGAAIMSGGASAQGR